MAHLSISDKKNIVMWNFLPELPFFAISLLLLEEDSIFANLQLSCQLTSNESKNKKKTR